MKNPSMMGVAVSVLALLSVSMSSLAAQEPGSTLLKNKATQNVQIAEPKPVPGIPDVIFGPNPLINDTSTAQALPTRTVAQNSEREIRSVVEPQIPRGVPQNETSAEPQAETQINPPTPTAAKTGWYAGASLGRGGLDTGYQRTFQTIFSTGATTVRVVPDTKDT
ncbi:MAG: hypothetical protein WAO76_13780, partial [Georgfuchsia sp.]